MSIGEFASGQKYRWRLLEKMGEGDAGEVFLVESLLDKKAAVMKRPARSAFATDVLRQATQIRTEGRVLRALESLQPLLRSAQVRTPALLDQSQESAGNADRLFIIIEKAPGIDLQTLAKAARYGLQAQEISASGLEPRASHWLAALNNCGSIPDVLVLRILAALQTLLARIHVSVLSSEADQYQGIIWNDIKSDHIFWEPFSASVTVIDWGNGKFLGQDGISEDRRASQYDDNRQFIEHFGRFLLDECPALHTQLEWPEALAPGESSEDVMLSLANRIHAVHGEELLELQKLQAQEQEICYQATPGLADLHSLAKLQTEILKYGSLPDWSSAARLRVKVAQDLAESQDTQAFLQLCQDFGTFPGEDRQKWDLLAKIMTSSKSELSLSDESLWKAVSSALMDEWGETLWELLTGLQDGVQNPWWEEISQMVRHALTGDENSPTRPFVMVNRLFYTLQSAPPIPPSAPNRESDAQENPAPILSHEAALQILQEDVIKKWQQPEPMPPNADLPYNDLEPIRATIERLVSGALEPLDKALLQARAHIQIVLDAWARKDFDTARRGLRRVLVWDPDRMRLVGADAAIRATPNWLVKLQEGPAQDANPGDYFTEMEFSGRKLRNRVGPASWLDTSLETLRALRKGSRPADLMIAHPDVLVEMPWLSQYHAVDTISLPLSGEMNADRPVTPVVEPTLTGRLEGVLNADGEFLLGMPLDTWVAEARGSSARVFQLNLTAPARARCAIKIMRPDKRDYALPLFREEVQILSVMRDVPGVNAMLECGFVMLDEGQDLPAENLAMGAGHLSGLVMRFGIDQVQNYVPLLEGKSAEGWLPYIALQLMDDKANLMNFCDAGRTNGRFLHLRQALMLSSQICDLLQAAHDRNIVYRDHKILHYYWDQTQNGVVMIDWNIARRFPEGVSPAERSSDLVQFSARALHHIFTGRPAPGALPLGPNRPEDIEQAAHQYATNWTYDDERLPNRLKEILSEALGENYSTVRDLRQDLLDMYRQMPDQAATDRAH